MSEAAELGDVTGDVDVAGNLQAQRLLDVLKAIVEIPEVLRVREEEREIRCLRPG